MLKIILSGCNGQMGKVITEVAKEDKDVEITAGVDISGEQLSDYPVYKDINDFEGEADAIIDFSKPAALPNIIKYCEKTKTPAVLAATGYSDEELEAIKELGTKAPVLFSRNMSLGINVMLELLKKAAASLPGFDVEIVERHHNKKVDSPSGTAFMLANAVNEAKDNSLEFIYGREGNDTKRKENELAIHAVRGGTIVGEHDVLFAGLDELIEIKHTALSKKVFANGSINAAKFMAKQPVGLYDMSDMFSAE